MARYGRLSILIQGHVHDPRIRHDNVGGGIPIAILVKSGVEAVAVRDIDLCELDFSTGRDFEMIEFDVGAGRLPALMLTTFLLFTSAVTELLPILAISCLPF